MKLFLHPDIYVSNSTVHGFGVFTSGFIGKDTVIEECKYLEVCSAENSNEVLVQYRYSYPQFNPSKYVVLSGYGSYYNHSEEPNVTWQIDFEREFFVFKTTKNVFANQELFTYYGDVNYWNGVKVNINK